MSLREIVKNILNIASGHLPSDDDVKSERNIEFLVHNYRSALITEYYNKTTDFDPFWIQDLGIKSLTLVDKSENQNFPIGCNILKITVPPIVKMKNDMGLYFVGAVDKQFPFVKTNSNTIWLKRYNIFTSLMNYYYRIEDDIFVAVPSGNILNSINIKLVLQNPLLGGIDRDNNDYPISAWMVNEITKRILLQEYKIAMETSSDETNNARSPK